MSDRLDMDFGHDLIDNGTSDDYYTPPFIFNALKIEFDMDVAAPFNGVPWIPAKKSLTIIDDGLTTPWVGRVWCNPPYSNPTPWAKKLIAHNNGIALIQTSKSAWFNLIWNNASGCLMMPSNLKFVKSNGESAPVFMPTMLFSFGESNRQLLVDSGLGLVR
jgi:hypothetical protein